MLPCAVDLRAPARLDDGRRDRIDDQRRAFDRRAGAQRSRDRSTGASCAMPPARSDLCRSRRGRRRRGGHGRRRRDASPASRHASTRRLRRPPARSGSAKPKRWRCAASKAGAHRGRRGEAALRTGSVACVAQMRAAISVRTATASLGQRRARLLAPARRSRPASGMPCFVERQRRCVRSRITRAVGESHAIGREHAGERMDHHRSIPSASATRQACCPPAPPKRRQREAVTSCPRATDIGLIALAMLATAMREKPSASCRAAPALAGRRATSPQAPRTSRADCRDRAADRLPARRRPGRDRAAPCRARHCSR